MIVIIDIIAAALFGVAVATVFEGRWGPLLLATPLVGFLHGVMMLIKALSTGSASESAWRPVVEQLADPWMLIAAMVACATGSGLSAAMLNHSRQSQDLPFWLPDMEKPRPERRRRERDLNDRLERVTPGRTRRLVEEGYAPVELEPEFDAGPAPARAALAEPRPAAAQVSPEANMRREPRRRTLLRGRVCTDAGLSVPCMIRDLSSKGAAIKVEANIALPRMVSLIDVHNGIGHQAQVRWRFRDLMGVRFLRSFDLSAPDTPEAVALANRWAALRT